MRSCRRCPAPLLSLEHASDGELRASGQMHREIRQAALDEQSGQGQPALVTPGSSLEAIARTRAGQLARIQRPGLAKSPPLPGRRQRAGHRSAIWPRRWLRARSL